MGALFGTDGVRGIANEELTAELAYKLGRIGAHVLLGGGQGGKVLIGRDTRRSGYLLEAGMTAGFLSMGVDVISLGIIPTPGVAYLVRELQAQIGVVISASHNPGQYNGIKFFDKDGYKLSDGIEEKIEEYILAGEDVKNRPLGKDIGTLKTLDRAGELYMDYLKTTISCNLRGFKIVIDAGHGAGYKIGPKLLEDLGAHVHVINNQPDGMNINLDCGSTNPSQLQELVREKGANIGIALDGDADRLIAVDERGHIVDGDHVMNICAYGLKKNAKLKNNTVVATVMSNIGLDIALRKQGCQIVKTKVGDRYVLEEMLKEGYSLGGEQSGHIIFLDYNTTGDGLLTAIKLMECMKEEDKTLSNLANMMESYPQVLVNAKVKNENKGAYLKDNLIGNRIREVENLIGHEGRVLIRPSGTEPLVRVMLEGKDQEELEKLANDLAQLIETRLS